MSRKNDLFELARRPKRKVMTIEERPAEPPHGMKEAHRGNKVDPLRHAFRLRVAYSLSLNQKISTSTSEQSL